MKKIILILLVIFLFGISTSFADRNVSTTTGYSASTLVKTGDWKVYRISWYATSNGGVFGIYDSLTGNEALTNSNVKTEGSEATSGNGKPLDFTNKPLEGSTGLYLYINNATVVVEYE